MLQLHPQFQYLRILDSARIVNLHSLRLLSTQVLFDLVGLPMPPERTEQEVHVEVMGTEIDPQPADPEVDIDILASATVDTIVGCTSSIKSVTLLLLCAV